MKNNYNYLLLRNSRYTNTLNNIHENVLGNVLENVLANVRENVLTNVCKNARKRSKERHEIDKSQNLITIAARASGWPWPRLNIFFNDRDPGRASL